MVELQATIAQGGLAVAIALAAAIAGYAAASTRRPPRQPGQDVSTPDPNATRAAEAKEAMGRYVAAVSGLQDALVACESPRQRLLRVADKATATAEALTRCHELGLVAGSRSISPDWRAPRELHREGPRLPVIAWQGFDRAFETLMATLDDPSVDLLTQARVFSEFAAAARHVAEALAQPEFSSALARCTFCGKHGTDVRKVISSPYALICDECVDLCVEILEDDIGPDWRSDAPE